MDPKNDSSNDIQAQRDAATQLVRDQLNALYDNQPNTAAPTEKASTAQAQQQPYQNSSGNWQQYHSQWQDYYRKYYERYYVGKLNQAITEHTDSKKSPGDKREEELIDLRQRVIGSAKESAKKVRKSRHFIPFASAIVVVLVVAFLQYNQIIISNVQAYVSPGAIDPQNIVVDPTSNVKVPPEPRLIIPKINVDVPAIYDVANNHNAQMAAMQKGVAHFAVPGADSVPGQDGNTVFSGHSSNDLFDPGDYKFIFAQLDKLQTGDTIFVNYNSTRYAYTVTQKKVVSPTDVAALLGPTDKPYLTLITCTPLGTSLNRLLVFADQVSPDPSKATAVGAGSNNASSAMPGNAPTALERLFGAN